MSSLRHHDKMARTHNNTKTRRTPRHSEKKLFFVSHLNYYAIYHFLYRIKTNYGQVIPPAVQQTVEFLRGNG